MIISISAEKPFDNLQKQLMRKKFQQIGSRRELSQPDKVVSLLPLRKEMRQRCSLSLPVLLSMVLEVLASAVG